MEIGSPCAQHEDFMATVVDGPDALTGGKDTANPAPPKALAIERASSLAVKSLLMCWYESMPTTNALR